MRIQPEDVQHTDDQTQHFAQLRVLRLLQKHTNNEYIKNCTSNDTEHSFGKMTSSTLAVDFT